MRRIAVVTSTRAEYGLLLPLIRRISEDDTLDLMLMVTGGHLSEEQGMTIREIESDGYLIAHKIPILEEGNAPYDISVTMSNAIRGFAKCFRDDKPDMIIILGDRTEMLGVAATAMNERIPIAHICGGEVTEGTVDDCVRHAITKMSYLHFTETESYRRRVIQLGEWPDRVFNVGSLAVENILHAPLLGEEHLRYELGIPINMPYAVVTFHPVTLDEEEIVIQQFNELREAMESNKELFYLITKANTDTGGDEINERWEGYVANHENAKLVDSLGRIRYLSAVKYASFILGNSSSGMTEAPIMGTPTVNIGDRQKGRILTSTIINCDPCNRAIMDSMKKAQKMEHESTNIYGNGKAAEMILSILNDYIDNRGIEIKKGFYDIA